MGRRSGGGVVALIADRTLINSSWSGFVRTILINWPEAPTADQCNWGKIESDLRTDASSPTELCWGGLRKWLR
jgi:hypothetical protein